MNRTRGFVKLNRYKSGKAIKHFKRVMSVSLKRGKKRAGGHRQDI